MAHKMHTSEDYHRFGDVRSVSRGRRSSTPQSSPRHTSPVRNHTPTVPVLPLPVSEPLQMGAMMPTGSQPYNDPQEPKHEPYDKYTYALKRRDPSPRGSPAQRPAPEPQLVHSPPVPPPPQPYPDPLGPTPSAVWPLSNTPDPQGRKVTAYKNTNYASRRQHPKQLGYSSPVKKSPGPRKPRTRSQPRPAAPLSPPPPCWDAFVSMADAHGIKPNDIGLLFWDTAEQLCLHFGINDPIELAAIQNEWRKRHTGGDNPPPIVPPEPVPLPLDLLPPSAPLPIPVPPPEHIPVPIVHSPVPLAVPPPVSIPVPLHTPLPVPLPYDEHSPPPVTPTRITSPAKSTPRKSLPRGKLDWGAKAKVDTGLRR